MELLQKQLLQKSEESIFWPTKLWIIKKSKNIIGMHDIAGTVKRYVWKKQCPVSSK